MPLAELEVDRHHTSAQVAEVSPKSTAVTAAHDLSDG
jgi:hypothetical protein